MTKEYTLCPSFLCHSPCRLEGDVIAAAAILGHEVRLGMKVFRGEPNGSLGQLKASQNRISPGVSTFRLLYERQILSYSNHYYFGFLLLTDELHVNRYTEYYY